MPLTRIDCLNLIAGGIRRNVTTISELQALKVTNKMLQELEITGIRLRSGWFARNNEFWWHVQTLPVRLPLEAQARLWLDQPTENGVLRERGFRQVISCCLPIASA